MSEQWPVQWPVPEDGAPFAAMKKIAEAAGEALGRGPVTWATGWSLSPGLKRATWTWDPETEDSRGRGFEYRIAGGKHILKAWSPQNYLHLSGPGPEFIPGVESMVLTAMGAQRPPWESQEPDTAPVPELK